MSYGNAVGKFVQRAQFNTCRSSDCMSAELLAKKIVYLPKLRGWASKPSPTLRGFSKHQLRDSLTKRRDGCYWRKR